MWQSWFGQISSTYDFADFAIYGIYFIISGMLRDDDDDDGPWLANLIGDVTEHVIVIHTVDG